MIFSMPFQSTYYHKATNTLLQVRLLQYDEGPSHLILIVLENNENEALNEVELEERSTGLPSSVNFKYVISFYDNILNNLFSLLKIRVK